ncbi:AN1-type zinc finger protein 4-like [Periplaneta americana]|uniref:AN1-type zinc finger protein 4-like n=1 Tax=Periplaneta americana TaxID=6978 RepID=UPI0037E7A966
MSQHGYQPTLHSSLRQEGTMDLYIETLTGTAFEMTVSPFDTVMSIKSKIQRVEGIPVSHQHLLYNLQELDDSACLIDYAIQDGATLKLVLSMRGGPISTRRLPPGEELAWKELREFVENNREDMFERLPPGCRVTVLVFREGDQVNLFRVIENEDGTYSPLSESWSGSSIRNLFAEEEPEESAKRLQENSVTMGKMQELRNRMEKLSLQKKPKKQSPRVLSAKRPLLHNRRGTPRPHLVRKSSPDLIEVQQTKNQSNILQLPPISKSERNLTSATPNRQRSGGGATGSYLTTSSLIQTQNNLKVRRNRDVETRLSEDVSERDGNLIVNQLGRKGPRHQNLPAIVPTSVPHSGSKKSNNTASNIPLLDMKPRRNSDYGQGRPVGGGNHSGKPKNSREDLNVSGNPGMSVVSTPNIAILEEENDTLVGKEDFSVPPNPIIVPSKEPTTFTISQLPRERVTTALGSGQNRYRVSRFVLDDDDDRPKTSPDELTQQQKATQELCDILSDTKWHRQRPHRVHYSNSQLEMAGDIPKQRDNGTEQILQHEKKSTIDLTLPLQSSLIDVTIRSPRYGRRSVMLPSAKNRDVKQDRIENDTAIVHQTELNLESRSVRKVRRRLSASGRGSLLHPAHKLAGEVGHSQNLPQEIGSQSISQTPPKKSHTVRSRCAECKKRLNITNVYTCRCEKLFCAAHRYSELHNCTFDYKSEGRKILEQTNPLVTAPKLPKI